MHTLLQQLSDWVYVKKVNRYIQRMNSNPNICSTMPTEELKILVSDDHSPAIISTENEESFKILRSHIYMELIRRGEPLNYPMSEGVRMVLLRWAYLHHQGHDGLYNFMCHHWAQAQEEKNNPKISYFYNTELLTNQTLNEKDWHHVIAYFENFYTVMYRQQNKFRYADIDVVPTDLCENNVVIFRDMPSKESAYACVRSCINVFKEKAYTESDMWNMSNAQDDEELQDKIERIFYRDWMRELIQLQYWIQTCYPDETILNMLDFILNPASGMRMMYELSGPEHFSFESPVQPTEETPLLL